MGTGLENKQLPKSSPSPRSRGWWGCRGSEKHSILHPTLPCLAFVSLGEGQSSSGCPSNRCAVSKLGGCLWWGLGGDEDEEVFPYCINEYLYD